MFVPLTAGTLLEFFSNKFRQLNMNLKWVNLMQSDHNCFDTFYLGSSLTFIKMVMHMTDDGRKKHKREMAFYKNISVQSQPRNHLSQ